MRFCDTEVPHLFKESQKIESPKSSDVMTVCFVFDLYDYVRVSVLLDKIWVYGSKNRSNTDIMMSTLCTRLTCSTLKYQCEDSYREHFCIYGESQWNKLNVGPPITFRNVFISF